MCNYIFIDESGNLGMNGKDNYFIISALKIPNEKELIKAKRILKKIRQRKLKKKLKETSELKFNNSSREIKIKVLKEINNLDVDIHTIIINKKFTKKELREKLPILYSYLIKILLEKTLDSISDKELRIVLDRCMNKSQRTNFETYVNTQFLTLFSKLPKVEIVHKSSENEIGLQLVDFVSGSFGYKYNTQRLGKDSDYFTNLISDIIKTEKNNLFKEK